MGQAKQRREIERLALRGEIHSQLNEDSELIQIPLQEQDGCYRGIPTQWRNGALEAWKEMAPHLPLWLYRVDKYWIVQKWKTPNGNFANRGELLVEVKTNHLAKEAWLSVATKVEGMEDQLEAFKSGESAMVQFWWLRRFLMARSVSPAQKGKVNYWEYYPIIEVHHPDGTMEQSAIHVGDYLGMEYSWECDPSKIQPAHRKEQALFEQIIICEEIPQ